MSTRYNFNSTYVPTPAAVALGYMTGQARAISNCVGLGLSNGVGGLKVSTTSKSKPFPSHPELLAKRFFRQFGF
jgi:hypothetical protein